MRTLLLSLPLVAACAVDASTPDPLALTVAGPPPVVTGGPLYAGVRGSFAVSGATPRAGVVLLASATDPATGTPACPGPLAPTCLGLAGPVYVAGHTQADLSGEATLGLRPGIAVPDRDVWFQVATRAPNGTVTLSEVLPSHVFAHIADGDDTVGRSWLLDQSSIVLVEPPLQDLVDLLGEDDRFALTILSYDANRHRTYVTGGPLVQGPAGLEQDLCAEAPAGRLGGALLDWPTLSIDARFDIADRVVVDLTADTDTAIAHGSASASLFAVPLAGLLGMSASDLCAVLPFVGSSCVPCPVFLTETCVDVAATFDATPWAGAIVPNDRFDAQQLCGHVQGWL